MLHLLTEAGITWDGTISFGSILAGVMVALAVGGAAWSNGKKIAIGLAKMEEFDKRLEGVEIKVDDFPLIVQKLVDGKEKMDDHEARLRALERGRAT